MNNLNKVTLEIPKEQIKFGDRARKEYPNIKELQDSIELHGLIHPILVEQINEDFFLIAGGRRLKAIISSDKLSTVRATVVTGPVSTLEAKSLELEENIQRDDLTWSEKAELTAKINALRQELDPTWRSQDTAKLLNVSPAKVALDLLLNKAVKVAPELAQARTADEANKLLKHLANKHTSSVKAAQYTESIKNIPAERLKQSLINAYVISDALELMRKQNSESFDLIEIDPPFAINLHRAKKTENYHIDELQVATDYTEWPAEQYTTLLPYILDEAKRILKPTGWCVLWFAPEPWFEFTFTTFNERFISRRLPGEWIKPGGQAKRPELYFGNAAEWFFYGRKSEAGRLRKSRTSTFDYNHSSNKKHPTEKPVELLVDLYSCFVETGDKVLIPFLGSGNGILAASNLNVLAIGSDLSQTYRDNFIVKVKEQDVGRFTSSKERK